VNIFVNLKPWQNHEHLGLPLWEIQHLRINLLHFYLQLYNLRVQIHVHFIYFVLLLLKLLVNLWLDLIQYVIHGHLFRFIIRLNSILNWVGLTRWWLRYGRFLLLIQTFLTLLIAYWLAVILLIFEDVLRQGWSLSRMTAGIIGLTFIIFAKLSKHKVTSASFILRLETLFDSLVVSGIRRDYTRTDVVLKGRGRWLPIINIQWLSLSYLFSLWHVISLFILFILFVF